MTTIDLYNFFRQDEPEIHRSTVNWRLYELVKKGTIERVGRGKFKWGGQKKFEPIITPELRAIHILIKNQFPFVSYSIWDTSMLQQFHQHLSISSLSFIDVEKEAMEPVFLFLRNNYPNTYLKPDKELLDRYIINRDSSILVRQLISEAPIQIEDGVPTVTAEKMLVDMYCDDEFEYLWGREIIFIFKNIFQRYSVNRDKMLRYASRKGKKQRVLDFLANHNFL